MRLPSCTSSDQNTSRHRILIADDHAIFVEALRAYLEKTYAVIGAVADGRAMLQEAIRLRPDVVVADVSMPLLNGLDAARRIREQAPKVTFVFLTMLDDANLAAAALELGRVAFVLKCCGGAEVLKALEDSRNQGQIGSGLEAQVKLTVGDPVYPVLDRFRDQLRYLFIVSAVTLEKGTGNGTGAVSVQVNKADGSKCDRCWNYSPHVGRTRHTLRSVSVAVRSFENSKREPRGSNL